MRLPFFIASDHAGFDLKTHLLQSVDLGSYGRDWVDLGPTTSDSVDYPTYAKKLCSRVLSEFSREQLLNPCGILICGSGVGVSISANRFHGIRAVLAWDAAVARLSRQHNATNILCLGQRLIDFSDAQIIVHEWMQSSFEGGRHQRRVDGIEDESLTKG